MDQITKKEVQQLIDSNIIGQQQKYEKELMKRLQTWTKEGQNTVRLLIKEEFDKEVRQIIKEEIKKI